MKNRNVYKENVLLCYMQKEAKGLKLFNSDNFCCNFIKVTNFGSMYGN